jgi:hypothetical protein
LSLKAIDQKKTPLGFWISARLGTGKTRMMVTLFVLDGFRARLSYFFALQDTHLVDR